jgi:hypothetical protein
MLPRHCELPPATECFWDVYKCPVCKQWWRTKNKDKPIATKFWFPTSRIGLSLMGLGRQCRSFLRHNRKERT